MMQEWRLADAKNRFSELVNKALQGEPQQVSRRDESVVIISLADYQRLLGQRPSFKEFLLQHTPDLSALPLTRDKSSMREVEL